MPNTTRTNRTEPIILAVDTSSPHASFAIAEGQDIIASLSTSAEVQHSRTFFSHISTLLKLAELEITEVDLFASATGPGSFTGLRVGLAAIKGLAYASGKPPMGINSIDAIALSAGINGALIVVIDAGRNEVYCGLREVSVDGMILALAEDRVGAPLSQIAAMIKILKGSTVIFIGDGALKYQAQLDSAAKNYGANLITVSAVDPGLSSWQIKRDNQETAVAIARHSARLFKKAIITDINPYYIRRSDAEVNRFGK
jgi:tRNA threonylcarbamoyladenosine biosynthesis protein TsaB